MNNINTKFHIQTTNSTTNNKVEKNLSIQNEQKTQPEEINLNNNPLSAYNRVMCKHIDKTTDIKDTRSASKKNFDCLLGGAIGDALGRPVERLRSDQMLEYYGKKGIRDLATVGLKARITDDTQQTMFTADGLIRSALKNGKGNDPDYDLIYNSYKDWYTTQTKNVEEAENHGWLSTIPELYSPAGPGRTSLSTLGKGIPGSIENPLNESRSCGGVMKVAPAGLMYDNPEKAFEVAARCTALTHGHPDAYLPSGVFAAVISNINNGKNLEESFENALEILKTYDGHEQTLEKVEQAIELAKTDMPTAQAIESLGYGFTGDEALAISTYCVFKMPDNLKEAVILAVNHSGDSDSTGAITGNILGLYLGTDSLPKEWTESLELKDELKQLAKDMADVNNITNAEEKYPIN